MASYCAVTRSGLASRTRRPKSAASASFSLSLMAVGSMFTATLPVGIVHAAREEINYLEGNWPPDGVRV